MIDGLLLEYLSTRDRRRTTDALALFSELLAAKTRPAAVLRAVSATAARHGSGTRATARHREVSGER